MGEVTSLHNHAGPLAPISNVGIKITWTVAIPVHWEGKREQKSRWELLNRPALAPRLLPAELSHMATANTRETREKTQLYVQRKRNWFAYSGLCHIKFRGKITFFTFINKNYLSIIILNVN